MTAIKTKPHGPLSARVMIVGEAPGAEEEKKGIPFVGPSGKLLDDLLATIEVKREDCFITNVCKYRPPNNAIEHFFEDGWTKAGSRGAMKRPLPMIKEGIHELAQEIQTVRPNLILALGNTPLWALQNLPDAKSGIGNWRGSELPLVDRLATMEEPLGVKSVVVPTYHPAAILRNYGWRPIVTHDLRARARKYLATPYVEEPPYNFIVRPTYEQAAGFLGTILRLLNAGVPTRISCDIETRKGHISCIGLAVSKFDALCIPLMCVERAAGYWPPEEEEGIVWLLSQVLTHPCVRVVGQNFLYDAQYFAYHLGFVPLVHDDTMFQQHVAYAGFPKGLDFLSSMYCEFHRYWKEEGKEWNPKLHPEEQHWTYNCKDAVITYEVAECLDGVLDSQGLRPQYEFQMELWQEVLRMMLRGIDIDKFAKANLATEIYEELMTRQSELTYMCGHELNPRSHLQMKAFFYDDLGFPKQKAKKKNKQGIHPVTLDEEALQTLARKEPLLRDLFRNIVEQRSLGVFLSTFIEARLGPDGRMRCYFNPTGTETYRWSSSEDAFGSGANLQNIPKGLEDEDSIDITELFQYKLPNIRKLFKPDPGYTIAECDQAGADAQVVAWRADDEILKQIFRERKKLHVENGRMMYGSLMGVDGKREPYYTRVKQGVHLTNYLGTPRTLSMTLSITMHEAETFQKRWFSIHPQIVKWQRWVQNELATKRQLQNNFGYRRMWFDRLDECLTEGIAWEPQSTVANVSNFAVTNLRAFTSSSSRQATIADHFEKLMDREIQLVRAKLQELGVQMLLQVHDSIVFQYPTRLEHLVLPLIRRAITITIPFADPLIIPMGLKTSTKSWGDAEEREWPKIAIAA